MTILVNCTRQVMTCEPINIIDITCFTLGTGNYVMEGHTEFWGSPLVLYCTVSNIPLTKLKFTCKFFTIINIIFNNAIDVN